MYLGFRTTSSCPYCRREYRAEEIMNKLRTELHPELQTDWQNAPDDRQNDSSSDPAEEVEWRNCSSRKDGGEETALKCTLDFRTLDRKNYQNSKLIHAILKTVHVLFPPVLGGWLVEIGILSAESATRRFNQPWICCNSVTGFECSTGIGQEHKAIEYVCCGRITHWMLRARPGWKFPIRVYLESKSFIKSGYYKDVFWPNPSDAITVCPVLY